MLRQQVFDATVRRSNTEQRMRLGAEAGGRIVALGHEAITSNLPDEDFFEPVGIGTHFLYAGENRRINHDVVRLNWLLSGSMRAPGEAVGMVGLECAMDELAEAVGIDPIALRKINDPEQDPELKVPYSSRQLTRALEEGAKHFGWDQRQAPGARREGDWLIGMGVASAARSNMLQQSSAKVELHPDGTATVSSAMTDIGTGSYTIMAQIAAEILGLPVEKITMALGDTNDPPAAGSGGSWGAGSAGSAVYLAAERVREKLAKAMGVDTDSLTLKDGMAIGDNRSVPIGELVGKESLSAVGTIKPGQQEKQFNQASYGAHFAEVGVNVVTGEVRVRRMLGVFAAGACAQREDRPLAVPGRHDLRHRHRADRGADPRSAHRQAGESRSGRISCAGERRRAPAGSPFPRRARHPRQSDPCQGDRRAGHFRRGPGGGQRHLQRHRRAGARDAGDARQAARSSPGALMSDHDSVLAAAREWRGEPMAIATVVSTWGSAPRPRGSHMLVHADGRFEGSVSGGCVENDILHTAAEVIAGAPFQLKRYGVADASAWEVGLPCGGEIAVMVQPVSRRASTPNCSTESPKRASGARP